VPLHLRNPPRAATGYHAGMMRLTLLLTASALLAACGQSGALYLPDRDSTPVTVTPAATPATPATPAEPDRSNEPRKQIH
jgi:predicted small lipoprotein YifL